MSRIQADLAITAAAAVLAPAATAVRAPLVITAVLGIALLAAPGYVLGQLLFGSHVTGLERIAVATGLALCVPVLGGLLIVAAGLPLNRSTWLALLAGLTLVGDVILLWQRRRGGMQASFGQQWKGWRPQPRKTAAIGAAVLIAISAIALARIGVAVQHYPGYTQLWLVRPGKSASVVNLGVGNHEGRTVRYRLVVSRGGRPAATWNFVLANGQAWHRSPRYPVRYALSANLFRLPDVGKAYRHVTLLGDGTPAS